VASGWLVAMAPFRAMTTERVPRELPAGRSPAGCCMSMATAIIASAGVRIGGDYQITDYHMTDSPIDCRR
jgi:hypothetical protein